MNAAAMQPEFLFSTRRLVVFGVAAIAAVACRRWFGGGLELWFALAAIAIAIWHGAFDGVLAEEALQPRFGDRWKFPFSLGYLALGAFMLVLWWWVPVVALTSFLLYSALHFGTESERQLSPTRLLNGLATGFVPIAAACHWWPQAVAAIFGLMLRGSAAAAVPMTAVAGYSLWPVVAVALLGAFPAGGGQWVGTWVLIAIELLIFRGCTPVVAFAVFFCIWHTPEHILTSSIDRSGQFQPEMLRCHLRRGAVPWLASLAGMGLACWFGRHEVQSYVGIVFLALSALTVPHMVLAEICRRGQDSISQIERQALLSQPLVIR